MPKTQKPRPRHPLEAMQSVPARLVFAFILILTLVLMAVLLLIDRPLHTAAASRGIISFEFAGSVTRVGEIVESWEGAPAPFASFSLGLDYLYMAAHATTIAWACIWASRMVQIRGWPFVTLGILRVQIAAPWPQVAWMAAALNFALILAGLLYSVFGVGAWLTGRTKRSAVIEPGPSSAPQNLEPTASPPGRVLKRAWRAGRRGEPCRAWKGVQ